MGDSENYLFFWTYCSLRSQSCLKHTAKWVNEVEWVSKVKVILWPWSKVIQNSKLNVWLLAYILRWAIHPLVYIGIFHEFQVLWFLFPGMFCFGIWLFGESRWIWLLYLLEEWRKGKIDWREMGKLWKEANLLFLLPPFSLGVNSWRKRICFSLRVDLILVWQGK